MKTISLNNGRTYLTAEEAMPIIRERGIWDALVNLMDDETREYVVCHYGPDTEDEFLARYLEVADHDLVID